VSTETTYSFQIEQIKENTATRRISQRHQHDNDKNSTTISENNFMHAAPAIIHQFSYITGSCGD
jgi:hypothetical protein